MPRVLIVDDNDTNAYVLRRIISKIGGWDVSVVASGEAAVASVRESIPDLVLLDLNLPQMSGEETLRTLRADDSLTDLVVVVVTADTDPARRQDAMDAGANDILSKPVDRRSFEEQMRRMQAGEAAFRPVT